MTLLSDLRHGWREFRSTPSVSAVAVATLALGVAGATTMFAMLTAITDVMVPPSVDGDRVGRIVWTSADENGGRSPLSADEYAHLRAAATQFESLSASTDESMVVGTDGPSVPVKHVSAGFFRTFGFQVSAGRAFTPADERAGSERVVIVSESFLRRNPGHGVGRPIRLGTEDYTIIGTLPDRCWFPVRGSADAWLPLSADPDGFPTSGSVTVTARIRPAVAPDAARAQVAAIGQRLTRTAGVPVLRRLRLITLDDDARKRTAFGLVGLLGPSLVVLLIACGNVANLLLARGARREREMAVRAALGAGRLRLMRERLAESTWIAVAGGVLGALLAVLGTYGLRLWVGSYEEARQVSDAIRLDSGSLVFALAITLGVPFVFGLVPAFMASRPNLLGALHQAPGRRKPRRGPYGGRDLLVVVEVCLAVVLVVMTVMYSRAFAEVEHTTWGFDANRVLAVDLSVDHGAARRGSDTRLLADIVSVAGRVQGVEAAAAGDPPDLPHYSGESVEFEKCAGVVRSVRSLLVGPNYFAAVGLPVRRGRAVEAQDTPGSPPIVVISEAQAAGCWPAQDPIGRRVRLRQAWLTVVGVVGDTMKNRLTAGAAPAIYLAQAQADRLPGVLLIRSDRDVSALTRDIRAAIRRVDPGQPLASIERLGERYRRQVSGSSVITGILGAFGVFALVLGALGVFSVMSYMVAERTREFGIRIALGASRRQVQRLVLRQAFVIVVIGTAVSSVGTLGVTRVAFREMAELAATDPVSWLVVASVLASVAVGAGIVPARRAMRVEPAVALRAE